MELNAEERILASFKTALANAERGETPYTHWFLSGLFPNDIVNELRAISFPPPVLEGVSGKRELHNDQRHYFDKANTAQFPAMAAVANAFQDSTMVSEIEQFFGADLAGTFLRIEHANDVDGFWLEPHTDLGVKKLTVLIYMSDGPGHEDLGTDIFNADKSYAATSPFAPNMAMAFVPGANTYHGFRKREIKGVRQSMILNYVTTEWRAREQLAFPETTVISA